MAKDIHDSTSKKIFVVYFTNHAFDQFFEDLINSEISSTTMIWLKEKFIDRTKSLIIWKQVSDELDQIQSNQIGKIKNQLKMHKTRFHDAFNCFWIFNMQKTHFIKYFEFSSEDFFFWRLHGSEGEREWYDLNWQKKNCKRILFTRSMDQKRK